MNNIAIIHRPIKSEQDLDAAFARIDEIIGAQPGTPEGEELDLLRVFVAAAISFFCQ